MGGQRLAETIKKNARKVEACRRLRTSVKRLRNIGLLLIRQLIILIRRRPCKIVWRPRVVRWPFFDGTAELSSKDSVGRTKRCPFVVDPTLICNSILPLQTSNNQPKTVFPGLSSTILFRELCCFAVGVVPSVYKIFNVPILPNLIGTIRQNCKDIQEMQHKGKPAK